jgi:phage minor structural protein
MIPILYESTETKFDTNGLGRLAEAITCTVTEERNGEYYLDMTYPISGMHYKDIQTGRLILARPEPGKETQPFEIKHISRPMNGIISIEADHISYRLSNIPVMPFTASNAAEALNGLVKNSAETNPFTVWTDKAVTHDYKLDKPQSFRACLGGTEGSLLDTYGTAEFEFDRFRVLMHLHRGTDRSVAIRYGKNLSDIEQEESIENTITGICPYWTGTINDQSVTVTLPEKVIQSDTAEKYAYHRTVTVDLSQEIKLPEGTDRPTEDMLRAAANDYMNKHSFGVPEVSLTVSYVDLADTVEYKDRQTEQVNLCDTVTVIFDRLGVDAAAEVISVEYDVLMDRYNKIELGSYKNRLSDTILKNERQTADLAGRMAADVNDALKKIQENKDTFTEALQEEMERADENTDQMIKSLKNLTGHAFIHYTEDGQPYEFIVADNTDLSKAAKVWRWNESGLAYSSTGYNGTYAGAAITADGSINADYITTGKITAVDIEGVNIEGVNIRGATIKGSEFSTRVGEQEEVISVSKGTVNTIIGSTVVGSLYAAYGVNADGSTNEKRGVALSIEDSDNLWLSYRNGTYENGRNKYSNILSASGQDIKDGHTPRIANTATGFMNFGVTLGGNGVQSHPNNYGIEIEHGLIKSWLTPRAGLVRVNDVLSDKDHDISIGWDGSNLLFWVDNTNVCTLPSGYKP